MTFIGTKNRSYQWFLIFETGLYLGFLALDGAGFSAVSSYIKYSSIFALCIYVTVMSVLEKKRWYIPFALIGSVIADYFLLFTEDFAYGILAFILVQSMLFCEISQRWKSLLVSQKRCHHRTGKRIAGRILGILLLIFVLYLLKIANESVALLAAVYIICFAGNVGESLYLYRRDKSIKNAMFTVGMILFFLCDLHVGLFNLDGFVRIEYAWFDGLIRWAGFAMWLFYLPGQTLIGLSNLENVK